MSGDDNSDLDHADSRFWWVIPALVICGTVAIIIYEVMK